MIDLLTERKGRGSTCYRSSFSSLDRLGLRSELNRRARPYADS